MTQQLRLTTELVSLVHYVELNESGWVRKTLGKIVLSVLARAGKSMRQEQIRNEITASTSHDFGSAELKNVLSALAAKREVIEQPKGCFRVPESQLKDINRAVAATEAEERATEADFVSRVSTYAPGLDGQEIWQKFLDLYLQPMVRNAGANTLNLLSGSGPLSTRETLQPLLDALPAEVHDDVSRAVVEFLNPSVSHVRQFILKRVAASFFVAAVGLDERTIRALDRQRASQSSIRLFLDTNTLFSVLGLCESDADNSIEGLLSLNQDPAAPVKVKLFVFPDTIEEAMRVLSNAASSMGGLPYPKSLATAARRANLSGIRAKYLEAAAKSPEPLSAEAYFSPYIKGLKSVLKSRGIEVIDRSLLVGRQDQTVIDDVLNTEEWEARNIPENKRKPHHIIFHDVYVWHCVHSQREPGLASPLEAKEWFVTLDRRMIAFDAFKSNRVPNWVPVCIDPSTFVQYAQFWTPRSPQFEEALFSSLRLPLLFPEFDRETENVSVEIISRLARIENVGDFTADELQSLLLDSALRTRFAQAPDEAAQTEIVRDELLAIHKDTAERAEVLSAQLRQERMRRTALVEKIATQEKALTHAATQHQHVANANQHSLSRASAEIGAMRVQLESAQKRLEEMREQEAKRSAEIERRKHVGKYCLLHMFLPFTAVTATFGWALSRFLPAWTAFGLAALCAGVAVGGLVKLTAHKNVHVQATTWLKYLSFAFIACWLAGVGFMSTTANAVYSNYLSTRQDRLFDKAIETAKGATSEKAPEGTPGAVTTQQPPTR
ncbi:hypothetical protein AWB74_06334 [Caballeronia arvi]|uniref:Uncharacterized protein n=1 Tax=Caballeronia arvi TaxID=1777135 RepID=A0A158KQC4_9BURK|nr:hypothetical protein [Caballeronia arvi]SAL82631.1 hypothetical protein AWB74_06334 [Caballeronia arvi]